MQSENYGKIRAKTKKGETKTGDTELKCCSKELLQKEQLVLSARTSSLTVVEISVT